jgi:hypothetical protein
MTIKSIIHDIAAAIHLSTEGGDEAVEKRVKARLAGLKIGRACSRCGGSGHYSRNAAGSTTCYRCGGSAYSAPVKKAEWVDALDKARAAAADGSLDHYLMVLRGRRLAKKAGDRCMAAWQDTGISSRYHWSVSADAAKVIGKGGTPTPKQAEHLRASTVNEIMCRAYESVSELARTSPRDADKYSDAMARLPGVLDRSLRVIAAAAVLIDTDLHPTIRDAGGAGAHLKGGSVFIPVRGDRVAVVTDGALEVVAVEAARDLWRSAS